MQQGRAIIIKKGGIVMIGLRFLGDDTRTMRKRIREALDMMFPGLNEQEEQVLLTKSEFPKRSA